MNLQKPLVQKAILLVTVGLFSLTLIAGSVFLLSGDNNIVANLTGWSYLVTVFMSLLVFFWEGRLLKKDTPLGNRLNIGIYDYFLGVIISVPLMLFGNFLVTHTYSPSILVNNGYYIMIYVGFFGSMGGGLLLSGLLLKHQANSDLWVESFKVGRTMYSGMPRTKKVAKILIKALSGVAFLFGLYVVLLLFGVKSGALGTYATEMFFPQMGLFFSILFAAVTVLLLRTIPWTKRRQKVTFVLIGIVGIFIASTCALPALTNSLAVRSTEKTFSSAFGSGWEDQIPADVDSHFLQTPFPVGAQFLGIHPTAYQVKSNLVYYKGAGSPYPQDQEITLRFDVYMPAGTGVGLPGKNATIIRIHGGSWRYYDKGLANQMGTSKYLAAQGYIVFDIQYGLNNSNPDDFLTPADVSGNFSIEDMLRHIGEFTKYLSVNAQTFGANLDKVFISGGSAGGHLTCATALAMASGNYSSYFSPALTVKGFIPFYPANGIPVHLGLDGRPELNSPELLVTPESPPCLVFQGLNDGLVNWRISARLAEAYKVNGSGQCAVYYHPFTSHANDLFVFESPINLAFTYYIERFLYLCVESLV